MYNLASQTLTQLPFPSHQLVYIYLNEQYYMYIMLLMQYLNVFTQHWTLVHKKRKKIEKQNQFIDLYSLHQLSSNISW